MKIKSFIKILVITLSILLFACSGGIESSDYPEEVRKDMYDLCLVTHRYGYCKCYVDNWQKNISYDRHVILKPKIDEGRLDDPAILELLLDIDKNCKSLPTSEQGW
ncbi:MAG: hypothetical protein CL723_05140 [Chloroflexi bacterium]|jgi:hypothetical protein|nr:hypothetical protein [Chloroflexota bacterium]|tara:strand:+ start:890 stop:1207 length:318 start_codon:yes stop_codon:yes gene_type:complete